MACIEGFGHVTPGLIFCSGHSTQDIMLRVTKDCKLALDGTDLVGIMFIDFSKAITHC